MRKLFALTLALVLTFGAGTAAFAAWFAVGAGTAWAKAGELGQGATPLIGSITRADTASTAEIPLRWSRTPAADRYEIRRTASVGGQLQAIGESCDVPVSDPGPGNAGCIEALAPEGRWRYAQRPRRGAAWVGEWSGDSAELAIAPAKPSDVQVQSTSSTSLEVTWVDNSTTADRFIVERWDTTTSSWEEVADDVTTPSLLDTGRECGQTSSYVIRAHSDTHALTSTYSDVAIGETGPCTTAQAKIVDLSDESQEGNGSNWRPRVGVTVEDSNGNPVEKATVTGDFVWFNGSATGRSCQTDENGYCLIDAGTDANKTPATFTVQSLTHSTYSWDQSGVGGIQASDP